MTTGRGEGMNDDGINVRSVGKADRNAIVSIVEGAGNLTREEKDCAVELLDIYLNDSRQRDYFFIAAVDGSDCPIGYVCYGKTPLTDAVYDMYWIVVDERRRRSGVGAVMLKRTEALLKESGARMLVAETSGLPSYDGTRAFYLRCGFIEESRIREFYKPLDDLIVYVKRF